jgi:uncharacterized protein (TIGR03435 family)
MKRALAGISFLALLFCLGVSGQSGPTPSTDATAAPAVFEVADIHMSKRTTNAPFFTGGVFRGGRYAVHNATMVDLIAAAYGVDNDKVLGGPAWLETDRYDVIAKASASTKPDALKPMLQALLADRFKLVAHADTKPVPVFALTVGKGKPKMKESDGSGNSGCQPRIDPPNPTPGASIDLIVACHNVTMDAFATTIRQFGANVLNNPVIDSTGLKGTWDFELKWTIRPVPGSSGSDNTSIFDAVDKQLGLKLEAQKAPLPVIVVESASEKPTDNPPGIAKSLPAAPPAEFEVAIIKPSPPDANPGGRMDGSQISLQAITLKSLMTIAWNLNPNDSDGLVGAPKWLDSDKFDIIAKVSTDMATGPGNAPQMGFDDLQQMLRALLIDRFHMEIHMEDRPVNAYTLVADKPKLTKADPMNRTKCKEGPGPDGKDPRIANPVLNRLLTCQNMTMAEFADQLQSLAGGYIYYPVKDATGLEGGWDFTLSFSAIARIRGGGGGGGGRGGDAGTAPPGGGASTPSDPNGAVSLFDAVSKQLGLKLVKEKRPLPVLVIDHVDEKPTDN